MARDTRSDDSEQLQHMRHALELASAGAGRVSPNPLTGSVVVHGGEVLGEGYHAHHGARHAEIAALDACRERGVDPRGAHLFCNLEPCARTYAGKLTPPCTERIIRDGIATVTISTLDPDPHVSGEGIRQLRAAGIDVRVGALADQALLLNLPFFTVAVFGRPFVHLKMAQSLDGRIAAAGGDARWITDDAARAVAHRLRGECDAILVGRGTVLSDDPQLTVRVGPNRDRDRDGDRVLWRVVLDGSLGTPPGARLLTDRFAAHTIIITAEAAMAAASRSHTGALQHSGARILAVPTAADGRLDLRAALAELMQLGIRSVLVEGGSAVTTSFLRAGLFDQLTAFIAPIVLGAGTDAVGDLGISRIADAVRLQQVTMSTVNDQAVVSGYHDLAPIRNAVLPQAELRAATARAG